MLLRIVCKDGLMYHGLCDQRYSNDFRIRLVGHVYHIYKREIKDMFSFEDLQWNRVIGSISTYDHLYVRGMWPSEVHKIISEPDI